MINSYDNNKNENRVEHYNFIPTRIDMHTEVFKKSRNSYEVLEMFVLQYSQHNLSAVLTCHFCSNGFHCKIS